MTIIGLCFFCPGPNHIKQKTCANFIQTNYILLPTAKIGDATRVIGRYSHLSSAMIQSKGFS
jgi:hypothetical protein